MAKILYEVKRNQNAHSAAFGKWYAQIKNLETLNTRKLANHISEHGSIYTPDVVYGVLEKWFTACWRSFAAAWWRCCWSRRR